MQPKNMSTRCMTFGGSVTLIALAMVGCVPAMVDPVHELTFVYTNSTEVAVTIEAYGHSEMKRMWRIEPGMTLELEEYEDDTLFAYDVDDARVLFGHERELWSKQAPGYYNLLDTRNYAVDVPEKHHERVSFEITPAMMSAAVPISE